MTREAQLELRVEELESIVESLKASLVMKDILIEEAQVLASAEKAAADEMERRMAVVMGGQLVWAARA